MSASGELEGEGLDALARTLLADVPDAVIYADRAGTIRFWNAGAERIFGFSKFEAIGRSLDIIIPERLRQRHWDGYARMMQTGQSRYGADELLSVPAVSKAGESLSIQFTVAPVRNNAGDLIGIVALLRNITATFRELKRLRAEAAAR